MSGSEASNIGKLRVLQCSPVTSTTTGACVSSCDALASSDTIDGVWGDEVQALMAF